MAESASGARNGNVQSPFEALVLKRSPYYLASFEHGATVLRSALAGCGENQTMTITPLRGAMPMVWSADGFHELESRIGARFLEVPIGMFSYKTPRGDERSTSPTTEQKRHILRAYLNKTLEEEGREPSDTSIAVLDEVQKGGTLGTAVNLTRKLADEFGFRRTIRVFAAQDVRGRVVREEKTPGYKLLASNHLEYTPTTVVPMPLVASDKDAMLDTVVLDGDQHGYNIAARLRIIRNDRAEIMFRTLGSLARLPEVRHDEDFIDKFVNSQGQLSERAAGRVEVWKVRTVELMDHFQRAD